MIIESAEHYAKLMESENRADQDFARRSYASVDVWLDVIQDYPHLKDWVLLNYQVPVEIIERLSHDPDVGVRMTVASKNKLSAELIEQLARDESADVRRTIAHHPKIPIRFLEEFLHDPDEYVRKVARWRLKIEE